MLEGPVTVSRYVLMGKLASGGMGTVYRARLRGEGGFVRDFALKRLHPHFADDPEAVSMFLDEARLAALIRHPNVVTTIDMGREGSELFVVMALVDGASVAHLLEGGPLPAPMAIRIAVDALAGLSAAHDVRDETGHPLELVHRDVSPANVLVGRDGQALLTDFGIAKARARLRTTVGFELKGKLAYMAPEQMERVDVDARADVFAMGVVLWEMLRGERLLHGDRRRLRELEDGTSPAWFPTGAGSAIDAVLLRALQREPTRRFASAAAMAEALTAGAPRLASHAEVGRLVAERAPTSREEPVGSAAVASSSFASPEPGDGTAAGLVDVAWGTRARAEQEPLPAVVADRASVTAARPSRRIAVVGALAAALSCAIGAAWYATRTGDVRSSGAPDVTIEPTPSPPGPALAPEPPPPTATARIAEPILVEASPPKRPAIRPPHSARPSPRRPAGNAAGSASAAEPDPFGGRR